MWRRTTRLSPVFSGSKLPVLNQAANGMRIWQMFSAEIQSPVEGGASSRETTPFVTFVLGGPGSGKGTQCKEIAKKFGFTHISAGDLLRELVSSKSEHDAMISRIINEGKIVPSEVTVKLLQKAIVSSENDKFLIDGFPRNEENRLQYERIIGAEPNMVLFFDCPEEVMVKRLLNRNQGRTDDNRETIMKRLKVFSAVSLPVIDYYYKRGKLYKIDGTGTEDEVFRRVCGIFAALKF